MRVKIRMIIPLAALFLFSAFSLTSAAETSPAPEAAVDVKITEVVTTIGDNYVRYPQLAGMENTAVQQTVNDEIVSLSNITQRLITLTSLQKGGTGLQVDFSAYLHNGLFSTVIGAKGILENLRSGQAYTALSYDLSTGQKLRLADFFTDPGAAISWMEEQASGYTNDLSGYLENMDVLPLPDDSFSFDENGMTFWYPYKQFALLSGYSGAVQFQYGELQEMLIREPGSVPDRLGVVLPVLTDEQIKAAVETSVSEGKLPYLSVRLNDPLTGLVDRYRLVRTPDQYPGGRYFQLEAPEFRQVLLLTDALTKNWDASVVEGILTTRMNLFGLRTGVSVIGRWREILGEPDPSVSLDASTASDYGLPAGTMDYYSISGRHLMLYADEKGVLYAVRLTK